MNSPDITVIIPTYNRADLLPGAVDSVLAQDTPHTIEAVVIDDGSTDHTEALMKGYVERHGDPASRVRVRYEPRERGGVVAARNFGIESTNSPYVAFLDSDDFWAPAKNRKQMEILESNPDVGVVHTSFRYVNDDRQVCDDGPQRLDNPCQGRCSRVLLEEDLVIFSSTVMRRSVIDRAVAMEEHQRVFDPRWVNGEDYDLLLRASLVGAFGYVAEPLTFYRMHGADSAMANLRKVFSYHCRVQMDFALRHGQEIGVSEEEGRKMAGDFLYGRTESAFWRREIDTTRQLCELARELGINDERFEALERKASRPAWQYKVKDRIDGLLGRGGRGA